MRRVYYGLGILTVVVVLAVAVSVGVPLPWPFQFVQLTAADCKTDDEISAEDRAMLDKTALGFVHTLLGANPETGYPMTSAAAQQAVSREQFLMIVRQATQSMGPLTDVRVTQAHLATVTMGQSNMVICGSLGRPEEKVVVAANPGSKHAHLLVEGEGKNNGWVFVLWFVPEPEWRVQYFHVTAASMVGRSARDVWTLARDEQQRGHKFNTAVLYATATQLAYRGPNFALGILQEIQREAESLEVPPEIQGPPPFTWKFANGTYKILNVSPLGVGGKIYLTITQETDPWPDDQAPDRHNRALIAEFRRVFPEYATVFAGLVVAAREPGGNRIFRTVDAPEETKEEPTHPE